MKGHLGSPPEDGAVDAVDIVLEGGPPGMPSAVRAGRSAIAERKLKIPYLDGYEHFELVGDAGEPARFRWTMRTKIAE